MYIYNHDLHFSTTGFDLTINNPAVLLMSAFRTIDNRIEGDRRLLGKLCWDHIHASYGANFIVRYDPEFLASAMLYGCARTLGIQVFICAVIYAGIEYTHIYILMCLKSIYMRALAYS